MILRFTEIRRDDCPYTVIALQSILFGSVSVFPAFSTSMLFLREGMCLLVANTPLEFLLSS